MDMAEAATITNIVPATAAIKECLAVVSFPGSPEADKNKRPVITQRITTTPDAI